MKRIAKSITFALVLAVLFTSVAMACPTCGDGIGQSDPQGQGLARGMYYSILFMMSMPFVITGTLGCAAYLSIRRARLATTSVASDEVPGFEVSPTPQQ